MCWIAQIMRTRWHTALYPCWEVEFNTTFTATRRPGQVLQDVSGIGAPDQTGSACESTQVTEGPAEVIAENPSRQDSASNRITDSDPEWSERRKRLCKESTFNTWWRMVMWSHGEIAKIVIDIHLMIFPIAHERVWVRLNSVSRAMYASFVKWASLLFIDCFFFDIIKYNKEIHIW